MSSKRRKDALTEVKLSKMNSNDSVQIQDAHSFLNTDKDHDVVERLFIATRDLKIKYMITFMIVQLNNKDTAVYAVFHREKGIMNILGLIYAA